MKRPTLSFFLSLCLLASGLCSASVAQTAPQSQTNREVLTNASIIELARMGLSDDLIIAKIRQSDRNFDTSVAGLRQLRTARVSDAVIREMLNPQAAAAAATPPTTAATPGGNAAANTGTAPTADADPLLATPREPGIYLRDGDQLIEIFPTVFTGARGSFLGTALTYGIRRSRLRAVARGSTANARTAQTRPEFYFYFNSPNDPNRMTGFANFNATSPGEFILVQMERKSNSRETTIGEIGAFSASTGARSSEIRDFTFERVRPGIFRVTPRENLAPGEYCFFFAGTPAGLGFAGGKLFDFSVALSTP